MTINELANEVIGDLTIELQSDTDFNADILEVKVKNAIREIIAKRSYPESYTEARIVDDLNKKYYPYIVNLSRYDYNQIGAEGQKSHAEDDINRNWVSRDNMFIGIHTFVKVL